MQVEEELAQFIPERGTVLTIGVFDGVHLGHQYLMDYLKRQSLVRNFLSGVVTFRRHPKQVLLPQAQLPYLTSLEERVRILQELGIDLIS
jgi:riboflavin kinase/FMN adenylyltransferase